MTTHELKTWPVFFEAVSDGRKTFGIRKNDRGFQTGDLLLLQKFDPKGVRGPRYITPNGDQTILPHKADTTRVRVIYVLNGFGIEPGFVVMGIQLEDRESVEDSPRDKSQIHLDALAQVHEILDPTWDRDLDDDWDINDPAWLAQSSRIVATSNDGVHAPP